MTVRPFVLLTLFALAAVVAPAPAVAATAPSSLTATAFSSSQISLRWADASPDASSYAIERSTAAGGPFAKIGTSPRGVRLFTDGRLASATTYWYRVRVVTVTGTFSPYSSIASAKTFSSDSVAPSVPTGLSTTAATCTQISLTWGPATDTGGAGLKGYNVYRRGVFLKQILAPTTVASDGGLAGSTTYSYTVSAIDNAGNQSAQSAAASARTPACPTTTTTTNTTTTTAAAAPGTPVANAGPDQFTQTLTPVALNASGSFDPDGTIVAYAWRFGDGASAAGMSAAHTYATAGTYTASVTVTDNAGRTGTDTATVQVANRPPAANAGADQTQAAGTPVTFSGTGTDSDGTVASFAWTFGDGGTATGAAASHAYATAGTYTAKLTVTDDRGAQGSDTAVVTVTGTSGPLNWVKTFGSTGNDGGNGVAVDAGGNVILTGRGGMPGQASGTLCPANSVLVAKFSPAGALTWSRCAGDGWNGTGEGRSVAVDGDGNVVVTGYFGGRVDFGGGSLVSQYTDIFLAKYAPNGTHLWSRRFGSATPDAFVNEAGNAIAVDSGGNILVTGVYAGVVDFGGGPLANSGFSDLFVAKFSPAGAHIWSRRGNSAVGYGIAVEGNGNVVLTGAFSGTLDLSGGVLKSVGLDLFVAKLSPDGAHLWSKRFGGSTAVGRAVAIDGAGNILVTGDYDGYIDFGFGTMLATNGDIFVAKFSPTGAAQWAKRLNSSGPDVGKGIAVDAAGNVIVTGSYGGPMNFGGGSVGHGGSLDIFVAKYTAAGAYLWAERFGFGGIEEGQAVAVDANDNAIVTGFFTSGVDFGGGTVFGEGSGDLFLLSHRP